MWQRLRSVAEWYLGVAPARAGESAQWSLAWGGAEGTSTWIAAVLAVAATLMLLIAWRQQTGPSRRWWQLLAFRWLALSIVALWVGELTLVVVRTGLPTLALLMDTSASMGLEDRRDAGGVSQTTGAAERSAQTRLPRAQRLLLDEDGALLRALSRRYRVHVYEFSDSARRIGQTATESDLAAVRQAIAGLAANGEETRPGPCLDQVLEEFRGAPPAAAVVFTDGIPSREAGELLSRARQPLLQRVPVYTVALGSGQPAFDLAIDDLQADPIVFVGDTAAIDFAARGSGLQGREAEFLVQREGQPAVLSRSTVTMPSDGTTVPVRLSFTPAEEGEYELLVTARPIAGELNLDNNVLRRRVQVRRDRIRVLLVERAPRWEYRHLKAALERDPNVELRTVLQESDLEHQREDRTALASFPATREDLLAYDVVILGDVDLKYLNPGALDLVRDFVGMRGGGLILIAGTQHNPADFQGTPLESLVPVVYSAARLATTPSRPFRIVPARAGSDHPLLRLGDDSRTAQFWEHQPYLNWALDADVRPSGGLVVATRGPPDQRAAVIVLQRFGAGQVLFHATDELWRWRRRVEDRYYGRYWRQAIRFLCRARPSADGGAADLTTDRATYRQGETVRFRLRVPDRGQVSDGLAELSVMVERRGGEVQSVTLSAAVESPHEYAGALPSVTGGEYHAWLAGAAPRDADATCDFTVEFPRRELLRQSAELRDLQHAAVSSGGAAVPVDKVAQLVEQLPQGQMTSVLSSESIPIWSRAELLLLFVGLLAADWLLRRTG
ncbi:MAG: VWA domain-containing protein [Planctomycetaceae bacterium]